MGLAHWVSTGYGLGVADGGVRECLSDPAISDFVQIAKRRVNLLTDSVSDAGLLMRCCTRQGGTVTQRLWHWFRWTHCCAAFELIVLCHIE